MAPNGRRPDEPSLQPEYLAKWQMMSKSLISGSSEYDPIARCLPPGMPAMMSMFYGMEVMQNKDKITFFSELNDALRRVYLDGRKPSQKVLDDPTYAGYSTGHWEGDTLVVDTVALRDDTFIEGFTPHSDEMTVHELIRFKEPGLLEDRITVTDPKALTKPWETVKTYRKAKPRGGDGRTAGVRMRRRTFGRQVNRLLRIHVIRIRIKKRPRGWFPRGRVDT